LTGARAAFSALGAAVKVAAPIALACLAAGCGTNKYYYGTPVVTLRSSHAGFTSYRLFIDAITLNRSDGFVASLLSYPKQVDLASLYDHTELLAAPAVPTGTYVSVSITFDYGANNYQPDINVNNNAISAPVSYVGTSTATTLPYLQNLSNVTIGGYSVTVTVTFDPSNQLVINNSQSTRLDFDVDLEAGNIIDLSHLLAGVDTSPTVYANPMVTVYAPKPMATPTTTSIDDQVVRARGVIVLAQPNDSNFVMNMHPLNDQGYTLGALTVQTTGQTYFNLDGVPYIGTAGLTALKNMPPNSLVAAYGSIAPLVNSSGVNVGITPAFNATTVIGGSSLESTLQSHVLGIVASRGTPMTQNGVNYVPLVIWGATYIPPDGLIYYYGQTYAGTVPYLSTKATLLVDPATTIVSQDGAVPGTTTPGPSAQSISVGDIIDASGQPAFDASGNLTLDASLYAGQQTYPGAPPTGQVRIMPAQLWGTVSTATPGSPTVNLLQLGMYQTSAFTFDGTGSTAASYVLAPTPTGSTALPPCALPGSTDLLTLPPPGSDTASLILATGFPVSFGAAPPDFCASTLTLPAAQQSELIVEWWADGKTGATQPFLSASTTPSSLTIDPSNAQLSRHVLKTGPISVDLSTLSTTGTYPVISTANASSGSGPPLFLTLGGPLLAINPTSFPSNELVFSSMTAFENEINTLQTTYTAAFNKLVAVGQYDPTTNTFNATRITLSAK
jgi:hypothetical protein